MRSGNLLNHSKLGPINFFIPESYSPENRISLLDTIEEDLPAHLYLSEQPLISDTSVPESIISLILFDHYREDWDQWIRMIRNKYLDTYLIAIVDMKERECIKVALGTPIDDLICLPLKQNRWKQKIDQILVSKTSTLDTELYNYQGLSQLVGKSQIFINTIKKIPSIGMADCPVLVDGESGTGKELCARAIHYNGPRSNKPFIPINCAVIPDSLFENELFGHEKGAFTDASSCRIGLLEETNGGTLFLDEIDSLSLLTQSKLLRFLEDKKYKPLGSTKYVDCDIRIICATNTDLRKYVKEGKFREDLYYRINVLTLTLPPLRHRLGDIPLLADHFLRETAQTNNRDEMFLTDETIQVLCRYEWPGNVRELKNAIEKAAVLSTSNIINAQYFHLSGQDSTVETQRLPFRLAKADAVLKFERNYLLDSLQSSNWNISRAASNARLDRRTFQRLVIKHNLTS